MQKRLLIDEAQRLELNIPQPLSVADIKTAIKEEVELNLVM
nr:hypothetical protein [Clostridium sp. 12(A)]